MMNKMIQIYLAQNIIGYLYRQKYLHRIEVCFMHFRKAVVMNKPGFVRIKFIFMTLQTCDFCMTEYLGKKNQDQLFLSFSFLLPSPIQSVYIFKTT